jgi:pseudaminic acid cytidylyltransferase
MDTGGKKMKTIMVVPAKGFSRRIEKKNLRPFCGLPLVSWAAILGQCSRLVDEVWVSTDSKEIEDAVSLYGAKVMYRRYQDTDETSGSVPIQETIDRLRLLDILGYGDIILVHLCTYPVLKPCDIDRLIMALIISKEFTDDAVGQVGFQVPHRTMIVNKRVAPGKGAGISIQGLNDYSIMTNAGSCTSARWAAEWFDKLSTPGRFVTLEPWQDHDVDTLPEWEYAELAMEHYILKGRGKQAYYEYKGGAL